MSYLEDPRVFFAGERTLFAMELVKTHASFYLGMGFVLIGWLCMVIPTFQFRAFFRSLDTKEHPPKYRIYSSVYVGLALSLLVGLLMGFLVFE